MSKLKHSQIADYRITQLTAQRGLCALCGQPIINDAVLDHDHKTGFIRKVLHRGCNAMLGKIENSMPMNRMTLDRLDAFAKNLVSYIKTEHSQTLHPTHKTPQERKDANKKTKQRRVANRNAKPNVADNPND